MESLLSRAFAPVEEAVESGRIAGAALGLVRADGARMVQVHGLAQRLREAVPLTRDTWFDLASLTKVIFTTTEILKAVEGGKLALDQPLAAIIPDLRQYDPAAPERSLTFRQLLSHNTHLPAVEPLYTHGQDAQTLRAFILQRVWPAGPPVYSDINFILLGLALERLHGRPLADFKLTAGFSFAPLPNETAATEFCHWRGRMLRGEVHDENAFALGGAAGHAGLFGTVDGVLDFALSLLNATSLSAQSISEIRTCQHMSRTLGWEIAHDNWTGGSSCSPTAIGHTGFTGTGLWVDFDRGLAWTLLTNRVHPSRHTETGIMALRRAVGTLLCDG